MMGRRSAGGTRVAIYARQSDSVDQGISQQVEDCRAEAVRRGWRIVGEYIDNDTSASKARDSRTHWAKMLRDFDGGVFDVLLVNDVDRLTRRLVDVLEVRGQDRDIRIVTVRGSIDTADPSGDFMFKQLVLLAEREVQVKTVRARRYAIERRASGHPSAGKAPHGYQWVRAAERDANGTRYEVVPDEAEEVRQIFREFLAGASLGQIARDLNATGSRTRRGARWHTSTMRRILLNPLYAALLPPAQETGMHDWASISIEECVPGAWTPIIELEHLLAARGRLVGVAPKHQGTARKWLLSGLAVCGVCRKPVRSARGETHPTPRKGDSKAADSKRYHAYRCVAGHFMRNGEIIDDFIEEACVWRLSKPDAVDLLAPRPDMADVAVLSATRAQLEGRETAIASLIASGRMSPKSAEDALDDLAAELQAVNDQIARAVNLDPLAELAGISDVREWWNGSTLARRRAVVGALMTVVINPVGAGRRVTTTGAASRTVDVEWITEVDVEDAPWENKAAALESSGASVGP